MNHDTHDNFIQCDCDGSRIRNIYDYLFIFSEKILIVEHSDASRIKQERKKEKNQIETERVSELAPRERLRANVEYQI